LSLLIEKYRPTTGREEFFVSLGRGFSKEDNFLEKFRIRPSAGLLKFMYIRISTFNKQVNEKKIRRCMWAVHTFREVGILVPGFAVRERNFWLFPMMYEPAMRRLLLEILWVKGVQGFMGST